MDYTIGLDINDHIILMSFELPIKIYKKDDGTFAIKQSTSMLYPLIFKLKERGIKNFIWIGWPGYFPDSEEEKQRIKILLNQH
jgi:trehalose-6-phosphate synthase